jgi:hypothetical protein
MTSIQSIGLPPERHANRIISEMIRQMAREHAQLWDAIRAIAATSSDGNPRAQRKLEARIRRLGAVNTRLTPGKRGRYQLQLFDDMGWDVARDAPILVGDEIPQNVQIVCTLSVLESEGRGRNSVVLAARPVLFLTKHAMSRFAQRLGARELKYMRRVKNLMWNAAMSLLEEKQSLDAWLAAPPEGWRAPIADGTAVVVLKRHEKREALIAATVF